MDLVQEFRLLRSVVRLGVTSGSSLERILEFGMGSGISCFGYYEV